jgi:GNAT superfamily N-acetyltransferase
MEIEVAHEHDIDTVLALIGELLGELGQEGQEFARVDREKLRASVRRNIATGLDLSPDCGPDPGVGSVSGSARFLALLARDESGTAIGVLTLTKSFALHAGGEYGVIDEMYVRRAYRGQGVGRQLVEAAMAIARQKGWFRLDVTAPEDEGGKRVVGFYERLGFEFTGPKLRRLV